jgi:ribonuclease HI
MNMWFVDGAGASSKKGFGKICTIKVGNKPIVTDLLIEGCTNNTAEYVAMLQALLSCDDGDFIHTDSQLVHGQLTKKWSVNFEHLQILHDKCEKILKSKNVQLIWISRDENLAGKVLERDSGREFPVGKDKVEPVEEPYVPANSEAELIWEINQFKRASELKEIEDMKKEFIDISDEDKRIASAVIAKWGDC